VIEFCDQAEYLDITVAIGSPIESRERKRNSGCWGSVWKQSTY